MGLMTKAHLSPLSPPVKDPLPIVQEVKIGLWAGLEGTENFAVTGVRTPDGPEARNEKLYWPPHSLRGYDGIL